MRHPRAEANLGGGAASGATRFEEIPISHSDSIEIQHTASPDIAADSSGVRLSTKRTRAFHRNGRAASPHGVMRRNGPFGVKGDSSLASGFSVFVRARRNRPAGALYF